MSIRCSNIYPNEIKKIKRSIANLEQFTFILKRFGPIELYYIFSENKTMDELNSVAASITNNITNLQKISIDFS